MDLLIIRHWNQKSFMMLSSWGFLSSDVELCNTFLTKFINLNTIFLARILCLDCSVLASCWELLFSSTQFWIFIKLCVTVPGGSLPIFITTRSKLHSTVCMSNKKALTLLLILWTTFTDSMPSPKSLLMAAICFGFWLVAESLLRNASGLRSGASWHLLMWKGSASRSTGCLLLVDSILGCANSVGIWWCTSWLSPWLSSISSLAAMRKSEVAEYRQSGSMNTRLSSFLHPLGTLW